MSAYPKEAGEKLGYTATFFPNSYFDPVAGARLYQERLEEYIYAEEMGVDGIMLDIPHNVQPKTAAQAAAIAAAKTSNLSPRIKIMLGLVVLNIFENFLTPLAMELDIDSDVSEFLKIFTFLSIFKLSLIISLYVSPCLKLKCIPLTISFNFSFFDFLISKIKFFKRPYSARLPVTTHIFFLYNPLFHQLDQLTKSFRIYF